MPGPFCFPGFSSFFSHLSAPAQTLFSSRRVGGTWGDRCCCAASWSTCKMQGSGAPQRGQSPAWFSRLICLCCQKSAMAHFSNVFSLGTALGTCRLSSVLLSQHLKLSPSALKSVFLSLWTCRAFPAPPCQSGALRQRTESCLLQIYWRWGLQAWCLRDEGLHNWLSSVLVLSPHLFWRCFGLMHSFNHIWQLGTRSP